MRKIGRIVCLLLALGLMLYALAGCNTWSGVGKDVERGGEAIQRSAD